LERGKLSVGQRNIFADRLDGDRQRLPIEVTDGDRSADQDGDPPPQIATSIHEYSTPNVPL
jgi:hypothetical protein